MQQYTRSSVPWTSCADDVSYEEFTELAGIVRKDDSVIGPPSMVAVPGGCCLEAKLLDTDRSDKLGDPVSRALRGDTR
eukprot:358937-Chlamydomonas_euryale.AAC.13